MNAVDKRVTQAPTLYKRRARIPQSSAFPHSPGDVLASNSEAGSECIASKNFRSPSIVARCLDASMNHGLRDGDPYNVGSRSHSGFVVCKFSELSSGVGGWECLNFR